MPSKTKKKTSSEYGRQLREKQELKKIYGLREKQLERYVKMAQQMTGKTSDNFLAILESRMDNIVFRLGFAKTRPQARQYVAHGLFLLNGRRVTIPSILVQPGEQIEPRDKQKFPEIAPAEIPLWLRLDRDNLKGEALRFPTREEIDIPVDERLALQFYSR